MGVVADMNFFNIFGNGVIPKSRKNLVSGLDSKLDGQLS